MKLSQSLLRIRKNKNLNQEQMAEMLNVSRQTISNWENNKSYPDLETIILISDIFKISLDELLKEDKKIVENLNRKIKMHKKLKIIIICLVIIILSIGAYFAVSKYKEYLRQKEVNERLDQLGFDKAKSGYLLLEEDGIGYYVFKSEEGKITLNEVYAETRDISSDAITISYNGNEARVMYLLDERITVLCDKQGNLKENANHEKEYEVYQKYQDKTVKMVKRVVELYDEIFD